VRRALPAPGRAFDRHDLEAYASSACRSLLGYDPEELVGRDAYELFHPDGVAEVRRAHSTILERPDTHTVGYRIRRKGGSYTWFETTSRTVRNPETDEVLEIIAVSRDVTERK
jgi:PAS domain S-box-containing protein